MQLRSISIAHFENASTLKKLSLADNQLKTIPRQVFAGAKT